MRLHALFCALVAAAAASAAQAQPSPQPETRSVTVRLDDLNLASTAGGATALRRIRLAAARACGASDRDQGLLASPGRIARCRAEAVEAAVAHAAVPSLTRALAEGRGSGMALAQR